MLFVVFCVTLTSWTYEFPDGNIFTVSTGRSRCPDVWLDTGAGDKFVFAPKAEAVLIGVRRLVRRKLLPEFLSTWTQSSKVMLQKRSTLSGVCSTFTQEISV